MKTSAIFTFSSDPKLNKRKELRKIQPLFKKQFHLSNKLSVSTSPSCKLLEFPHELPAVLTINPKLELETEEDILFDIKQLSGERLSALKDLFTYEEMYKNKLRLKSRLSNLSQLCDNLQDLLNIASSQLVKETGLYERLYTGIEDIYLQEQRFENISLELKGSGIERSVDNLIVKHEEFIETRHCVNISGLMCLVFVKSNLKERRFKMRFHLDSVDVLEYELQEFKLEARERDLQNMIEKEILSYFHFTAQGGKLKLRFEKRLEEISMVLIVSLKGIPYKYTAVQLEEEQDCILLSISEYKIYPQTLSVLVSKSILNLSSIKEPISSTRRYNLLKSIENNLYLTHNSVLTLEWGSHLSFLQTKLQKHNSLASASHSPLPLDPISSPQSILYSSYDLTLYQETLIHNGISLQITFQSNTILDTLRIILTLQDSQHKFREEDHKDEFLMLRSLQSQGFITSYRTVMRSLELKCFINKMLNLV